MTKLTRTKTTHRYDPTGERIEHRLNLVKPTLRRFERSRSRDKVDDELDSWLDCRLDLPDVRMDLSVPPVDTEITEEDIEVAEALEAVANEPASCEVIDVDNDLLTDGSYKETSGRNKLGRFILTIFPEEVKDNFLDPEFYWSNAKDLFQVWCGQWETCPSTLRTHFHIYAECKSKKRIQFSVCHNRLRKFHNRVQIQNASRASAKQRQCAINYCLDERKRMDDTEPFIWKHNTVACAYDDAFEKPSKNERGQEVDKQRSWIESKPRWWTWNQIVHECEESKALLCTCSWGEKYHKGRFSEDKRRTITDVVILYGAGGTGKTTMCYEWDAKEDEDQKERYYRRNADDGAFWGGGNTSYKGQRIVHYEEFVGQETFSRLKEVCDIGKPGPSVNVKNGGADLNHHTVLFSSNVHPAGWFRNMWDKDPKQFHPFWRRVTKVLFFPPHREDGSLNIPDEENPPYLVDQTGEWKEFAGDYGQCRAHAGLFWPLSEEEEPQPMLLVPRKTKDSDRDFFSYCKTGVDPTK